MPFPSLQRRERPTFYFIGVTTGKSSILKVFPKWMAILGIEAEIVGIDLPLYAPPEAYRAVVAHIRADPLVRGALVTTHKLDLLYAARDLFDRLDANAQLCEEVSCIARRGDRVTGVLEGYAVDPISSRLAWEHLIEPNYFADRQAEVLCFGCGGAAVATTVALMQQPLPSDHPGRFTLVDVDPDRLAHARKIHAQLKTDIQFEYILNGDPTENDRLMLLLPPESVVINATGLGKDLPGSPLTDQAIFPVNGRIWEFNYRGDLVFLQQAQRQRVERHLMIEDGWRYFLHGWTQVIAKVFEFELTPTVFARLEAAAQTMR